MPLALSHFPVLSSARWEPRRYGASPGTLHERRASGGLTESQVRRLCPGELLAIPMAAGITGVVQRAGLAHSSCVPAARGPISLARCRGVGRDLLWLWGLRHPRISQIISQGGREPPRCILCSALQDPFPASSFLDVSCSSTVTCVLWSRGVRKGFPWGVLPRCSVTELIWLRQRLAHQDHIYARIGAVAVPARNLPGLLIALFVWG